MNLHDYQKRMVNYLWVHDKCVLSVDMGLGKTISCLIFLDFLLKRGKGKHGKPLKGIIIAPKRVAENNWLQEATSWQLSELASLMVIVKGTAKKRKELIQDETKPIKIISRDNVKDITEYKGNDFLIIDELTSFKSFDAKRSKAVQQIDADRKIGLTGTFLANGAIDIYGQMLAIGLKINNLNFYAWRATYFKDVLAGSGLQFQKWQLRVPMETVLEPIKEQLFTLTAQDFLTIPAVTEHVHSVTINEEQFHEYQKLQSLLCCEVGGEMLSFDEGQKFSKLQTLCNGFVYLKDEATSEIEAVRASTSDKLNDVADFVEMCAEKSERVLLFYRFREEKKWLVELFEQRKLRVCDVKNDDFMKLWNDGDCDVLMAHPASAGHGLNLQHGGRIIVWSSLTYNFEHFAQANARLARQGQTKQVQIHYFVAKDTVEEAMVTALRKKSNENETFKYLTK